MLFPKYGVESFEEVAAVPGVKVRCEVEEGVDEDWPEETSQIRLLGCQLVQGQSRFPPHFVNVKTFFNPGSHPTLDKSRFSRVFESKGLHMTLTESFSIFSSPCLFSLCVNGSALNVLICRLLPQHRLRLTISLFG